MKRLLLIVAVCCIWQHSVGQQITAVEYFFDTDPGVGQATALSITPGPDITINETLPTSALSSGVHKLIVRAKNDDDKWAVVSHRLFFVNKAASSTSLLAYAEYYFDADPGKGAATPIAVSPGSDITLNETLDVSALSTGVHRLVVRTRNEQGLYSIASSKLLFVNPITSAAPVSPVDYLEYFVDTDPGEGNATPITVTAPGADVTVTDDLDVSMLTAGVHSIVFRARNQNGLYSIISSKLLFVNAAAIPSVSPIDYVEYFFDTDPGKGNATSLSFASGADVTIDDEIDVSSLTKGVHKLVVRARNEKGEYSILSSRIVFIDPVTSVPALSPVEYVEYFIGEDPGKGNATPMVVTPGTDITLDNTFDISAIKPGVHKVVTRARDEAGNWSIPASKMVLVNNLSLVGDNIIAVEYFVDNDPGTGAGKRLSFTGPAGDSVISNPELDVLLLGGATHDFVFRSKNVRGFWSYNDTITVDIIRSLASDSLILKLMYDSTKGPNWITKTNWLTGNIATWHGITIVNQEVRSVLLPDNNLDGPIPPSFAALIHLEQVDFSGNKITSVPSLKHIPNLGTLDVSDNHLDFGSIVPNVGIDNYSYSAQALIGKASTTTLSPANETFDFVITTPGIYNLYKWKRGGEEVSGATDSLYQIPSLTRSTMGEYICEITNVTAPGLTLTTHPQTVLAIVSISGRMLIAPDEAATSGLMDLLRVTSAGAYDTTQNVSIETTGDYVFENVVLDDYIIVSRPDTILYPRAVPTYFSNTIFWEEADTIELNGTLTDVDIIAQLEPEEVPTGSGTLVGFFEEEDGTGSRKAAKSRVGGAGVTARRTQGTGRGLEEIYELIAYTITDENGEFDMSDLPDGNYRLNIQYPGIPMDSSSFITFRIEAAKPLERNVQVEATVINNKITVREIVITGVSDELAYKAEVYPNPAAEVIHVDFEKPAVSRKLILTDAMGRQLKVQPANAETNSITVLDLDLQKGTYLLQVHDNQQAKKVVRVVIQ